MESSYVLQEKLEAHKRLFREADASIKRISGRSIEETRNVQFKELPSKIVNVDIRVVSNESRRKISLGSDENRSLKRKSYDEQKQPATKNSHRRSLNDSEHPEKQLEYSPTLKSSVVSSHAVAPIKTKEDLIKLQNKGANEQRNKRIFGHLLGTLSHFKTDDKERSSTTKAIHRKELEKKIEIQKIEDKKKYNEEKKKLEELKQIEQQNVEILEAKIQLAKGFEEWKSNQLQYKKFIRSETKPFIFYLPKELDEKAQKLLEKTASLIDEQIAKRLKETEAELDALTKKSARLNKDQETGDKENKESPVVASDSESEMMDDEKNAINVRLGDEEEEERETPEKERPERSVEGGVEPETSIENLENDTDSPVALPIKEITEKTID